jgi:hypothetical protein
MFAALQNLDYENREVHFAVTRYQGGHTDEKGFPDALKRMTDAVPLGCPWSIRWCWLDKEDMLPYQPILRNLALLRGIFLDGDYDYFLLLGGDNPPPRDTINRLLSLQADVACGLVYQRPYRGIGNMAYPLVYTYSWTLDDLPLDLPVHLRRELEKTWLASMFYLPIYLDPDWRQRGVLTEFTGGSGCTLIKREVLENVGFYLPETCYHSEDVNFFTWAKYLGYTTKCDLTFHVPHHDESGEAW